MLVIIVFTKNQESCINLYNLIDYNDNCSKASGFLWKYCRDEPAANIKKSIIKFIDFTDANLTDSFNLKLKLSGKTDDNGTKNGKIMAPLKYLSNFWRTFEMSLIDCEITLDLNWSEKCFMVASNIANQGATFSITDTKLLVPVVTVLTQDNAKLLTQWKSGFKGTLTGINIKQKYQKKESINIYIS